MALVYKARRAVGLILYLKARRAVGLILLLKARRAVFGQREPAFGREEAGFGQKEPAYTGFLWAGKSRLTPASRLPSRCSLLHRPAPSSSLLLRPTQAATCCCVLLVRSPLGLRPPSRRQLVCLRPTVRCSLLHRALPVTPAPVGAGSLPAGSGTFMFSP